MQKATNPRGKLAIKSRPLLIFFFLLRRMIKNNNFFFMLCFAHFPIVLWVLIFTILFVLFAHQDRMSLAVWFFHFGCFQEVIEDALFVAKYRFVKIWFFFSIQKRKHNNAYVCVRIHRFSHPVTQKHKCRIKFRDYSSILIPFYSNTKIYSYLYRILWKTQEVEHPKNFQSKCVRNTQHVWQN